MLKHNRILNPDSLEIVLPDTINENLQLPDPTLIQYYRDKQHRIIWMLDEIGDEVYDWIDFILEANRNDLALPPNQRKPIKCLIANYGGSLDLANMLASVIQLSITPIWGIALGPVCSAASMIYLACQKKLALPNAYWMIHKGSCQAEGGDYNTIMAAMDDYKKQIALLTTFYINHTKFTENEIKTNIEKDWYLYANDPLVIEKGICDGIITNIREIL